MKKVLLCALCLSLLAVTGTVSAEERGGESMRSRGGEEMRGKNMMRASTTEERSGKKEKPEMRRAIPGSVTSVSATGFTMTGRGMGKGQATTTLTVVVTPTTIFKTGPGQRMLGGMGSTTGAMGTTTGSLSDVIAGSKVEVFGKVSTSTNTITADKVHINRGKGQGRNDDKMEHMRPNMASGTPSHEENEKRGFLKKFKILFGEGAARATGTPSGGPASTGFLDALLHWFR